MPVGYYLIPMVAGPYSRFNKQRPDYVDAIECNWTGHNVDAMGVFVCKVNTTEAKHTDLASRSGVNRIPEPYTWDTVIADMHVAARNYVANNICAPLNIPYDETETIGEFLMRVINTDLFSLEDTPVDTEYQNLTSSQQNKVANLLSKWGLQPPINTETVKQLSNRGGNKWWNGDKLVVEEY